MKDSENTEHFEMEDESGIEVRDAVHPNSSPIPVLPQLSIALGLLVFVFSVTYIGASGSYAKKQNQDDLLVETALTERAQEARQLSQAFANTELNAKSAFVWDVKDQKVLFNKNADEERPLASVAKLMTALVAYELLDPEEDVTVSLDALNISGDSGFVDGETFTMQDLADITLISSSNDGATALGSTVGRSITDDSNPEDVFVRAMNIKAEELGLTRTTFRNSTGLDVSATLAGAYGTARDVAFLMEYIITNKSDATSLTTMDVTTVQNEAGKYHLVKNTNEIIRDIDGIIASKTGYTKLAGGNLVVAFNAGLNHPVIVVVLGSSEDGRFNDILELSERARTYITAEAE